MTGNLPVVLLVIGAAGAVLFGARTWLRRGGRKAAGAAEPAW